MMTARKRVGLLPTYRLAVRHSVDYSSSYHFASDNSLRDSSSSSPSSSLSETSSDPSSDDLFDSSSDHSLPVPSSGIRPSHHLCSLVPSIPRSSTAISDRPSHYSSSASPSRKRSRSPAASVPLSSPIHGALSYARTDLLPSPKRVRSSEFATDLEGCSEDSFEPYVPRKAGLGVTIKDESSDPSRYRGTDLEMDDDVVRSDRIDIDPEIQVEINECIAYAYALRDRGIDARVVVEAVDREDIKMSARGPVEVRVDKVTHPVIGIMPNTRSGASTTREGVNEQIDRRVVEALGARDAARNLEPLVEDGGEQEEVIRNGENRNGGNGNGGNGNGGANGNGNGNGGGNGYNPGGFVHVARECTYQDFLKCQPLSFNRTEGVVGALTWWNSHKRTIGIEVAYAMSWTELMKLMTEVYYPRNEIQKMETELWNLAVKGNDLTTYTRRFQNCVLIVLESSPNEEDKVKRFIGGLPDNIQGNVIAAEPTKLQDAIRITNNLMDQKLKGYARSAENKRRLENNPRDSRVQQPVFKRQNVEGQNVARAYTAGNNKKKGDCKVTVTPNTQRAPVRNQPGIVCYECGRPVHFWKDYPKLRNQNRRNQTGNKNGNKTKNQNGGNEATARAYTIRGG
ncbi:putative reverse transcriptase domain-containing protein [Tanacetum coccineum]|uniref:Reverse transcriptase domain-containing protein n=1 Tax=Tanacetum coccineum TaxID=301880 RepID=A0ABQ5DQA8_9ASTR